MQRTGSEEHARRSDGTVRQKVTLESSGKQPKFACRRMQRKQESTGRDAMPTGDRVKREGCNDTLGRRNCALQMEERSSEGEKMVAARGG